MDEIMTRVVAVEEAVRKLAQAVRSLAEGHHDLDTMDTVDDAMRVLGL